MGLFRADTEVAAIERAILKAKKDQAGLRARLPSIEQKLAEAVAERRTRALADDTGISLNGPDRAIGLANARDDVVHLIGAASQKIAQLETDLVNARDREAREAAISELSPHVTELERAIAQLQAVAKVLTPPTKEVALRVRYLNVRFATDLDGLLDAIGVELRGIAANARAHIDALRAGSTRIIAVPEPVPAPPPAAPVERVECLLLSDSKWVEGDQTMTAPRWSIRPVPATIAGRAIELGWCIPRSAPAVEQLIRGEQVSATGAPWHSPPLADCIDLATASRRNEAAPSAPPLGDMVEHVGPSVTGAASVSAT